VRRNAYRVALRIRAADGTLVETRTVRLRHGVGVGELIELPDGTRVRVRGVEPGTRDADVLVSATLAIHQPTRESAA